MADYNLGPYRPNPKGEYDGTESYRFLDWVTYQGCSYLCINYDTIDGTACIGKLPTGEEDSELYWMCTASKGDDPAPEDFEYPGFVQVENNEWDYTNTDKIYIPSDALSGTLNIMNVYDGCCGIIVTDKDDLILPDNSSYSIDFNYATIKTNQFYLYTFVYTTYVSGGRFLWNRTVMDQ